MEATNCWGNRDGIEAPHAFSYKLAQELAPSDKAWIPSGVLDSCHPRDVFCCVKAYMSLRRIHTVPPPPADFQFSSSPTSETPSPPPSPPSHC